MFKCAPETWVIVPGFLPNFHQLKAILTLFSAQSPWEHEKNRQVYCTWNRGLLEHITHTLVLFFMKAVIIIISIYVSQGMRFWVRRFCGYLSATIQPLPILRMFSVHISALAECTKCTTSKIGINANCQNLREANL